jgi:flagellar hook-basal body complex protein FliE
MVRELAGPALNPAISLVDAGRAERWSRAEESGRGFGGVLNEAINQLNESQVQADVAVRRFLAGEEQDLHQVVIALGRAERKMQLAIEVRNKVLEAYQQLARTPL